MGQLTENDAELYIASQMVHFLAQSRPFAGVKSPNGMHRFFSKNVTAKQQALINNTSSAYSRTVIAYLKKHKEVFPQDKEIHWFVVFSWNTRLCIVNEANRSQYTDILKPGDPITFAVIQKAKFENLYFDLCHLAIQNNNERYLIHK